jgi:hypothetical protein
MAKRDSFLIRVQPEVLDALRRWAEDEFRSANAQLELILVNALREAGRFPKPSAHTQPESADLPTSHPSKSEGASG